MDDAQAPRARRARRVPLNLRIAAGGKDALTRIAAHTEHLTGARTTLSDAARDAFALLSTHHDALARVAARRTTTTGRLVTPLDVAHVALRDFLARHDPEGAR